MRRGRDSGSGAPDEGLLTRDQLGNGGILLLAPDPAPRSTLVLGEPDAGLARLLRMQGSALVEVRTVARLGAAAPAELVVIAGRNGATRIEHDIELRTNLDTRVREGTTVMAERCTRRSWPELSLGDTAPIRFELHPSSGPMRAATASGDTVALDWLVRHGHAGRGLVERRAEATARQFRSRLRRGVALARRRPARRGAIAQGASTGESAAGVVPRLGRFLSQIVFTGLVWTGITARQLGRSHRELLVWGGAAVPRWVPTVTGRQTGHVAIVIPGDFVTQKLLVALFSGDEPEPVVLLKVARDPIVNPRVEAAVEALRALSTLHLGDRSDLPRLAGAGRVGQLAFVAEEAVAGHPPPGGDDVEPWLRAVAMTLIDIAVASRHDVAGRDLAATMVEQLGQFSEAYPHDDDVIRWLTQQASIVAAAPRVPLVLQHGDPGAWNLLQRDPGSVTLIDWENADPDGIPIADLAFLLRSAGVVEARQRSRSVDRLTASLHAFIDPRRAAIGSELIRRLATAIDLDPTLIGPLFYHGWVLQAVREAKRLPPHQAASGIFIRSLRRLVAGRAGPELDWLLLGSNR